MGNPRMDPYPSIMVAVKDKGLRYWPAVGKGPVPAQVATNTHTHTYSHMHAHAHL